MKFMILMLINLLSFTLVWGADDYSEFQTLLNTSISYRQALIERHKEVEVILNKHHILSGTELETINLMAMERFNQQQLAMVFIDKHSEVSKKRIKKDYVPSATELKSLMMALAMGVTLADNHLIAYKIFHTNNKLRRLLNEFDQAYYKKLNMLRDSIHDYYSLKNRKRLRRAILVYQNFYTVSNESYGQAEFAEISLIIENSSFYQKFKRRSRLNGVGDFMQHLGKKLFHFKIYALDIGAKLIQEIIYDGSEVFGNTLGAIRFRLGKLQRADDFLPSIKKELKVLDVVLERTPARATSNFIPGFWTHTAIYVGGEDDLKYYGLWDHPLVQTHQARISLGANTIEALRSGVEINPIDTFKDADTYASIRLKVPLSYEETKSHLLRAFAQIGKVYDFSFDIQGGEKIVCSELHYITYMDVPFNTSRILGRQTISVDQVAEQALTNREFDVVNLWLDGQQVQDDVSAHYDMTLLTQGRTVLTEEEKLFFTELYDLENRQIRARKNAVPFSNSLRNSSL